jgi:hypothetical protein
VSAAQLTALELIAVERVLQMGGGYVLDFSDRTFAAVFREHGVEIDDPRYSTEGRSKAKRLRYFLRTTSSPLSGQVLGTLLEHRLARLPEGIDPRDLAAYQRAVERLGGNARSGSSHAAPPTTASSEADLLARVFRRDVFECLPIEQTMIGVLLVRMDEAKKCISAGAYLSAVILCGSVLEGMCLGFGCRHPEAVNRAFGEQYGVPPPKFHEWKLKQWIEVLGRLQCVTPNVVKFGDAVRDFRNYVHPNEQLAHRIVPDERTARISFQVVVAAAEDLVRSESRIIGDGRA